MQLKFENIEAIKNSKNLRIEDLHIFNFDYEDFGYIFERNNFTETRKRMNEEFHKPVLLKETLDSLNIKDGGVYLDCTFGAGGHTRAILESANCTVIGLDRDAFTQKFADELTKEFPTRFKYVNSRFSDLDTALDSINVDKVDGILFDIGVSSMQFDTPRRGFSFQADGPLDMRMESEGASAEDFINHATEEEIAGIIFRYGDEKKSRAIARAIIVARGEKKIERTTELAEIIKRSVGRYNDTIHPATRTFQAIRIHVNDELNQLKLGLQKATKRIKDDGRVSVITFHSGEDIIVKDFFREISGYNQGVSRYMPIPTTTAANYLSEFESVNKKPIAASDEETRSNPRARSAKLRVLKKVKHTIN